MILQATIIILKTTAIMVGAVSLAYALNSSNYLQAVMERVESELADRVRLYDLSDFICSVKRDYESAFGYDSDSESGLEWEENSSESNKIHSDSDEWVLE